MTSKFLLGASAAMIALASSSLACAQGPARGLTAVEAIWLSQQTGRPILAVIGTCT